MKREREPTHSAEMLREDVLAALGMSVSEAARQLRVSRRRAIVHQGSRTGHLHASWACMILVQVPLASCAVLHRLL